MSVAHSSAITGIDIVTYLARDAQRAKAFYRDTLGLPLATDYGPDGAEFVLPDGAAFGIWKMSDGSFRPSGGVMFAVGDIESAVQLLKARGVSFEDDGKIEDTPVCRMAFASDSEGNTFLLHQRSQ